MSATHEQDETEVDLFSGAFIIRIATVSPSNIVTATVTPLNLFANDPDVTAIVAWEGIQTVNTTARFEPVSSTTPWTRFVQLLWVVLGPKTTPEPAELGPDAWDSVVLSTQELDGALHHSVLVVLERSDWSARLIRSDRSKAGLEIQIPAELRSLDAGTLLAEMTSRLLTGQALM